MRVSFVEVAGFRGFKDKATFGLGAGFTVLTGRNGAGKSTMFDAIEFALTGTISKFSVREAKGGGLQEHLWWVGDGRPNEHYVTVGFVDDAGKPLVIKRTREGGLETPLNEIGGRLCQAILPQSDWPATLMQTTLIRDETIAAFSLDMPEQARFNAVRAAIGGLSGEDPSKRIQAVISAADSELERQERRVSQAEAELGRTLTSLTEAQSIAARQRDVATATSILKVLAPDIVPTDSDAADRLRRLITERKRGLAEIQEAFSRAQTLQKVAIDDEAQRRMVEELRSQIGDAQAAILRLRTDLQARETLLASERERDRFAEHLVSLLNHGEALGLQEGHCPLCAAARSEGDFLSAINEARSRLSLRGERLARLISEVDEARAGVEAASYNLQTLESRLQTVVQRLERNAFELQQIRVVYERHQIQASPSDLSVARALILQWQEQDGQLEQALLILESSSAQERVKQIESRVQQLRKLRDDEVASVNAAQRAAESAKRMLDSARMLSNQILAEQFDTVLPLLKELYIRLRPHADFQEIEMDFGGKVRASLNFTVGDGKNPQFLFSSGQRRAAGLAFLLAIHLSRPWCTFNTLLLDDPVQHIDDYRALNLVEVLAAIRKTGRQVIVAVEDPSLADVLCRRLRSTVNQPGNRIELHTLLNGSAGIAETERMALLPPNLMEIAEAS